MPFPRTNADVKITATPENIAEWKAVHADLMRRCDKALARRIAGKMSVEALRRYDRIVLHPLRDKETELYRLAHNI